MMEFNFNDMTSYENMFEILDSSFFDDVDLCFDDNEITPLAESLITVVGEKKKKNSKKRKNTTFDISDEDSLTSDSCSSSSSSAVSSSSSSTCHRRKARKVLPVVAPGKYANYLVSAMNEQSGEKLEDCFKTICTEDAKVMLHVYNVKDYQQGLKKPSNPFGRFQEASMDLKDFVKMQEYLNEIVPDGCMELISSRSCFEGDSSVYISCIRWKGTILSEDSTIGMSDEKGNLTKLQKPKGLVAGSSESFLAEGSLIMYRNTEGMVTGIEFYYEFLN